MQQLTENEVWKDIPNYEGMYQASSFGNFRSLTRKSVNGKGFIIRNGINMKTNITKEGYESLRLCSNSIHVTFRVHILIAITFLNHKKCGHSLVVNHINGIKTDNRVCNLEIVTNRENSSTCKRVYSNITKPICVRKKNNKFQCYMSINKKDVFMGCYKTEETASLAYQTAVKHIDKYNGNPADFRSYIKSLIYNDSN